MSDIPAEVERWIRANAPKTVQKLSVAGNLAAKVKEFTLKVPDPVWTAPTLLNSWANFDATAWEPAGYKIDDDGYVELRGLLKGGTPGTTSVIFTLPTGYRQTSLPMVRPTLGNDGAAISPARLTIKTSGDVVAETGPTPGASGWWTIGGQRFLASGPCAAPPNWTSNGFPMAVDTQLGGPTAGVQVWSCLDASADYGISATSGAPLPRVVWRNESDGKISILRFVGLSPGRQYRVRLVFFAG